MANDGGLLTRKNMLARGCMWTHTPFPLTLIYAMAINGCDVVFVANGMGILHHDNLSCAGKRTPAAVVGTGLFQGIRPGLEDGMLLEESLEGIGVEVLAGRYHFNHSCQVGKEIALVPVG